MPPPSQPDQTRFLARYEGTRPPAPAWFEQALERRPERTCFQSSGANLELLTWGPVGAPGLLLLHGNGAHADWWSHIAPFFARDWRCAAFSFSGMGHSEWRTGGYSVAGFAGEVHDAVAAAALDKGPVRPVIVAHSFGGAVGMAAASVDDSFGGLIMIDTPVNLGRDKLAEIRARAPKARDTHLAFGSLEEGLARFRLAPPQDCGNDFIGDHIARCALVERNGNWFWHFDPRRVTVPDHRRSDAEVMGEVRCPIAYFYGDRSSLVTPGVLERSLEIFPAGTPVISIPDAAHHVLIDQPLALVSSLRTLLASWPPLLDSAPGRCKPPHGQPIDRNTVEGEVECPQS